MYFSRSEKYISNNQNIMAYLGQTQSFFKILVCLISALKGLLYGTVYFNITCNDIIGFPAAGLRVKIFRPFPKLLGQMRFFSGFLLNNFKKFIKQKIFLVQNWYRDVGSRAVIAKF